MAIAGQNGVIVGQTVVIVGQTGVIVHCEHATVRGVVIDKSKFF